MRRSTLWLQGYGSTDNAKSKNEKCPERSLNGPSGCFLIEKEYRIILFERYPNRLTPTAAGNRFYGYAAHIMSTINELNAEFKGEALTDLVRVGSTRALGSVFLPGTIREFSEVNPQVKVVGKVQNMETLTASLIQNEIDFAFVEGTIDTCGDELLSEEFRCDNLILIVPPEFVVPADKTMTLEDVAGYPLVQREPGSINRSFVDSIFRSHGIEVNPVFESFSIHSLVRAVHEGLGLAFLPQDIVLVTFNPELLATHPLSGRITSLCTAVNV